MKKIRMSLYNQFWSYLHYYFRCLKTQKPNYFEKQEDFEEGDDFIHFESVQTNKFFTN